MFGFDGETTLIEKGNSEPKLPRAPGKSIDTEDAMKKLFVFLLSIGAGTQLWSQQAPNYSNPPAPQGGATSGETTQAPSGRPPVSLRVVGSNLMNPQGQYLGRIEEVILNSANQIEFALVETTYPNVDMMVTPVPWSMLSHAWDQGKAGGTPGAVQTFLIPSDKAKMDQAPKISRKNRSNLGTDWEQRIYAFYGSTPGAIGAAGSGSSALAGGASGGAAATTAAGAVDPGLGTGVAVDGYPVGYAVGAGGSLITNTFATNTPMTSNFVNITNMVGTNIVGTNQFGSRTNQFAGRTNRFRGDTNFANSGTNALPRNGLLPGGTNLLYGRRQFPNSGAEPPQNNTGGTGSGNNTTTGAGGAFTPIPPVNPNTSTTIPTTILPPSNVAPPGTVVPPGDANPPGTVVPTVPGGNTGIFTPGTPTPPGNAVGGNTTPTGGGDTSGTGTTGGGTTGTGGGTTPSGGTSSGRGVVGGTAAGARGSGR
jgi:hypothetical protein